MMKRITLFVYLSSIILQNVGSFAPRLTQEQLQFKSNDDRAFSEEYAMQLCEDDVNFWMKGTSWESTVGPIEDSIYSEETKAIVDTGKPIIGYTDIKNDAYLTRNITQVVGLNCSEMIYNDDFKLIDYQIHFKAAFKSGFRGFVVTAETVVMRKYFFNKGSEDGTLEKVIWKSLSGRSAGYMLQTAKETARNTLSAAQYMGIIEEQTEGSERNNELLSKLVFVFLGLIGFTITVVIGYTIRICLFKNKKKVKYAQVPQTATESSENEQSDQQLLIDQI